jgi:hypothetical protein
MEKSATIFRKIKSSKSSSPRKSIIDNLISYSKSLDVIHEHQVKTLLYSNN